MYACAHVLTQKVHVHTHVNVFTHGSINRYIILLYACVHICNMHVYAYAMSMRMLCVCAYINNELVSGSYRENCKSAGIDTVAYM